MNTKSNWLQQVNLELVGQYDITKTGSFRIGQNFGLDLKHFKNCKGLRIANEVEFNAAVIPGAANLMTTTQLKCLLLVLRNALTGENSAYIPLTALCIDGTTEIKAGIYYEIGFPIDWENSYINVVSGVPLPATGYYLLSIQCYLEPA